MQSVGTVMKVLIFMLELLTEELFLKSNEDLVEIDSINLEVFNTDLSGY